MSPIEAVAPFPPVADRASVVDHRHRESAVDEGLDIGLPAVRVQPRRPAVDVHHDGVGPIGALRGHEEAVHLLSVGVREVPGLVRLAVGRLAVAKAEHLGAGVVEHEPATMTELVQEPDPPVGPDASLPDETRLIEHHVVFAGGHVVAEESVAALTSVDQQQRPAVRPPVGDEHRALGVQLEILPLAGREIPDRGPFIVATLVLEGEPLVAGHWRPAPCLERQSLVELLAERRSGAWIEHTQGGVQQVAVLRVLDAEESSVRREAAEEEATLAGAADANRLRRTVDLPRRIHLPARRRYRTPSGR